MLKEARGTFRDKPAGAAQRVGAQKRGREAAFGHRGTLSTRAIAPGRARDTSGGAVRGGKNAKVWCDGRVNIRDLSIGAPMGAVGHNSRRGDVEGKSNVFPAEGSGQAHEAS